MTQEGFKRKLTAILSADVVGYSRLMDDNEEATIRTLNEYRTSITSLIQQHRGRVVDAIGDNLLAEFTSAVDAVNCSVATQMDLAERNAKLPYERKMEFRIGVNLGDVIDEGGEYTGMVSTSRLGWKVWLRLGVVAFLAEFMIKSKINWIWRIHI